ncbi:helix-turn-helix domain-containing protein [Anatilimnocola sp. NA78]|uniref:helix-turn-helix domain-containing protein n=1 Tax=Anatilimnocola sp. NA78 TaxID=3415683 RepID=UPI003CE4AB34
MTELDSGINQRIAERVKELRAMKKFSLDELATKSGVSRSMISLIERGESSPTAVILERLAAGLNVTIASLFESQATSVPPSPLARQAEQPVWKDPASGYVRRNVSPPGIPQPMQLVEIAFPAGKRVAFDAQARDVTICQQIWVLAGTIHITVGKVEHQLKTGDCLAMHVTGPTTFHNPTKKSARYAVVMASENQPRKR